MDLFNHQHYLELSLLKENSKEESFDWKMVFIKRKKIFKNFKFIILFDNKILFNEANNEIYSHFFNEEMILSNQVENDYYILYFHSEKTPKKNFYFHGKNEIIIENIAIQKSFSDLTIFNKGQNHIYFLSEHISQQLFYQKIQTFSSDNLIVKFIQKPHLQKEKNEIYYFINEKTNLDVKHLVWNQPLQIQDDSVEVFHQKNSISHLSYLGLNYGKIASQFNSVINKDSAYCETYQKINHILLDSSAKSFCKPNLIIKNPNVVASHGNTIGKIQEEDLFYLKQRGISELKAKKMILISKIQSELQDSQIKKVLLQFLEIYHD
jgi:hypothetical protein